MLSILIPTYNFDVSELVENIHSQLLANGILFEIIIFEDGSTLLINKINNLSNVTVFINDENIGRVKARQFLAKRAKYDWLLFLDADVIPKRDNFILNYINSTSSNYEAIFGGFAYHKIKPKSDYLLRWKYGKKQEEVSAYKRNKTPYKIIISANYIVKKSVFEAINSKMSNKGYGYDNFYGALLKQYKIKVLHINNEVYHLGIEKSSDYLLKKEQAAETLLKLFEAGRIKTHNNALLKLFSNLKNYNLTPFFSELYKSFGDLMKRNLTASHPSIKILQLYRICYMCYKYRN